VLCTSFPSEKNDPYSSVSKKLETDTAPLPLTVENAVGYSSLDFIVFFANPSHSLRF